MYLWRLKPCFYDAVLSYDIEAVNILFNKNLLLQNDQLKIELPL